MSFPQPLAVEKQSRFPRVVGGRGAVTGVFVTYDERLGGAAEKQGLKVIQPV